MDPGYFDSDMEILGRHITVRVAYTGRGVEDWIMNFTHRDHCVYGIDVEWRPNFERGGTRNNVALLQLAGAYGCLIVQLQYMDYIPAALLNLLREASLAGVGVLEDTKKLYQDYGFDCRRPVDLGDYAAKVLQDPDLKRAGLGTLCAAVLQIPLYKNKYTTRSNWAIAQLSSEQIKYAATDACVCYFMMEKLSR